MDSDRITSTPSDGCSNDIQNMRPLNGRTSGPTRRSTKGQWTAEEDEILRKAVQRFKGKNWKKIAECFKDRTDVQCLHRWQKVLNPELIKGPWSKEEDEIIIELVHKHGPKKWSTIARHLPGRIGKQCRERWHNHLNPAINKEAWTQQEELALIRAHQIYGNRWAELSKFLPGRSDNAIKNHWNSSVKKKLESYLASGLLDQFPALPLAANHHQSTPASSSRMQSSGEDSGHRSSREAEEISECSQDANVVGYSQSAGNLVNAVIHTKDQFQLTEESGLREEHSSGSASFQIQEIPFEAGCSSSFLGPNLSHNAGSSASTGYQFNSHELPNISSMELGQESSGLPTQYPGANASHKMVNVAFETSLGFRAPASMENLAATPTKRGCVLISDDECCRVLFSGTMNDGCFSSSACSDSLLCQPSNFQPSESGRTLASNSYYPSRSSVLQTSCCPPSLSVPSLLTVDEDTLVYASTEDQLIGHPFGIQEQDFVSRETDGFIYTNDSTNSLSGSGAGNSGLQEQTFETGEPSKLVPVNSFGSGSDIVLTCPPVDEKPSMITEQEDGGALCYEPPRFPSVDVPFFSCDLIQSGSDMQQEYSPLGIRQLMMSSMNCITPFRLWDSPSRDGSPEAVLKSAAKTFTGTPSILKKRNRDLLSPLSDRRADKKLEIDVTSSLSKEFSRLDVLFDDSETDKESPMSLSSNHKRNSVASIDDQENLDPALEAERENQRNHSPTSNISFSNKDFKSDNFEKKMKQRDVKINVDPDTSSQSVQRQCGVLVERNGLDNSDDRISDEHFESGNSERNIKQGITDATDGKINLDPEAGAQTVEQHRGVLHEHKKNDLLIVSPDQVAYKMEKGSGSSAQIPRNQYNKRLGAASGRVIRSESSSGNPCLVVCSPSGCGKNLDIHPIAVTSAHPVPPSLPLETMVNNAGNENSGIFGETPFKRSSDSPSAWKSPWFINSFLPGPRIDTDITIEDIGYLMSPSERSYDAIGLMKQLSEHTAAAYAEALEVLGNDTPETILRRKCANIQNLNQENHMAHNVTENRPHLASNVLSECRVLDFSECGTPGKEAENKKSSTAVSFSSPSSYLMKGCR